MSCGCKSAENCGCGQDPCKTYGADYTKGYTDTTQKIEYEDNYGKPKEVIVQAGTGYAGNCPSCSKRINFPIDSSGLYCYDCQVYLRPSKGTGMDKTLQYDAETCATSGCIGCQMQKPVSKEERAAIQKQVDKFNEQLALDPDDNFERYILLDFDDENLIEDAFFSRQGAWKPLTEAFRKRWGKRSELMDKISLAQVGEKSNYAIYSFERPFWFEYECDPQDTATAENPEGYGLGFEFDMTKEEAIEKARQIHKETKGAITMYNNARKRSGGGSTRIHPKFWATPEMMEEQKEYYKREDMEWPTGDWIWEDKDEIFNAETFEANAKTGNKVYIITRRCEDYSAYRELDIAGFGSLTEARKKFNLFFKRVKEYDYADETIADAKDLMNWGEYWGIMSFANGDMIYELREVIVGDRGDFYFDAETFEAPRKRECRHCKEPTSMTLWKGGYGYDADFTCDECGEPQNAILNSAYEIVGYNAETFESPKSKIQFEVGKFYSIAKHYDKDGVIKIVKRTPTRVYFTYIDIFDVKEYPKVNYLKIFTVKESPNHPRHPNEIVEVIGRHDYYDDFSRANWEFDWDDIYEDLTDEELKRLNDEFGAETKGRFAEKPVLTGSVIGGIALGLIYLMRGK